VPRDFFTLRVFPNNKPHTATINGLKKYVILSQTRIATPVYMVLQYGSASVHRWISGGGLILINKEVGEEEQELAGHCNSSILNSDAG
jgi:hypothetical protein